MHVSVRPPDLSCHALQGWLGTGIRAMSGYKHPELREFFRDFGELRRIDIDQRQTTSPNRELFGQCSAETACGPRDNRSSAWVLSQHQTRVYQIGVNASRPGGRARVQSTRTELYLDEYIAAADIANDPESPLFRTSTGGRAAILTGNAMWQQDGYQMIQRRARAAGIKTKIGNHTFRATGITAYMRNGGKLETAQQIANHESPRTTKLYDRRQDEFLSMKSSGL